MDRSTDDSLSHYGVKGMKWGRRRADDSGGLSKKAAKADAKWEKKATKAFFDTYNDAADKINREIPEINNQAKYKDKDLSTPGPLQGQYYDEYSARMTKHLNDSAVKFGTSPSGKKRLKFDYKVDEDSLPRYEIVEVED